MTSLSVILITKNEAKNIRRCLESVKWADEIIVLDSGSTDDTVSIAKEYTPHCFETDWPGFGKQKNRALEKAQSDWVLSIDADECLSPELIDLIQSVLDAPQYRAYSILRYLVFNGKTLRFGHGKDHVIRLFKRDCGHFSNDEIHERVIVECSTGKLNAPILHYSFDDIDHVIRTMNHYSNLSAGRIQRQGKKTTLGKAIRHGLWTFFKIYILKRGLLNGLEGFTLAVSCAEGSYYRYLKSVYLTNEKNIPQTEQS